MKKIVNVLNLDATFLPFNNSCRSIAFTKHRFNGGELRSVFMDGVLTRNYSFDDIRSRLSTP